MNEIQFKKSYLDQEQAIKKYQILTKNRIKNLIFKNIGGFRTKVARKLGRRTILDEEALLQYLDCSRYPEAEKRGAHEKN